MYAFYCRSLLKRCFPYKGKGVLRNYMRKADSFSWQPCSCAVGVPALPVPVLCCKDWLWGSVGRGAGREGVLAPVASTDRNAATLIIGNCLVWIEQGAYSVCGQFS